MFDFNDNYNKEAIFDFNNFLNIQKEENYFKELINFVNNEYKNKTIFPLKEDIFNAFLYNPFKDIKVVIIGQDPYHGDGEAHGLAFSVKEGIKIPPSLKNIYKEMINEKILNEMPKTGFLEDIAKQGVLMINSVLTVEKDKPGSHRNKGWEIFTDNFISYLSSNYENIVFMLWGNYAISKENIIDKNKHLILKSPHPSPFSCNKGFFFNNHFIRANEYLKNNNKKEIMWNKI